MGALIASSSALFTATTGFAYSDLVTWAGSILTQILGGGLGLVNALIGWIIAIIIITVIVRLIYHGLRWLHILK
jgi:membrane protein insertase Oxa1/YidC/SpoIIIJ